MNDDDRDYCLRRAEQERRRAASGYDLHVARRHTELADLYLLRANDPESWAAISTQRSD